MNSGIYQIKNIINNKIYIGRAINVFDRLKKHYSDLIQNKHFNEHLQRSFNKYKSNNFEYSIICAVPTEQLDLAEKSSIYMFTSIDDRFGFNKTTGGEGGYNRSEETKQKISKSHTGKSLSEEHKKKISISGKIAQNRPEVLAKLKCRNRGSNNPMFGKPPPNKGKPMSEEHKLAHSRNWKIIRPDGTVEIVRNLNQYCKDNNLDSGNMSKIASGKQKCYKGYKIKKSS